MEIPYGFQFYEYITPLCLVLLGATETQQSSPEAAVVVLEVCAARQEEEVSP